MTFSTITAHARARPVMTAPFVNQAMTPVPPAVTPVARQVGPPGQATWSRSTDPAGTDWPTCPSGPEGHRFVHHPRGLKLPPRPYSGGLGSSREWRGSRLRTMVSTRQAPVDVGPPEGAQLASPGGHGGQSDGGGRDGVTGLRRRNETLPSPAIGQGGRLGLPGGA